MELVYLINRLSELKTVCDFRNRINPNFSYDVDVASMQLVALEYIRFQTILEIYPLEEILENGEIIREAEENLISKCKTILRKNGIFS